VGQDGDVTVLTVLSALRVLADETADSKTGAIGPGLTAFLVVAALGVATFLLIRSMLHQIKKVPPSFDAPEPPAPDPGEPTSDVDAER
jgi:hypothetical protein